jgi:hypothetical protein
MDTQLLNAISTCDLRQLALAAGGDLEVQPESSSWLLHYEVNEKKYSIEQVVFASPYIVQQIWKRSSKGRHNNLRHFLDMTADDSKWAAARGNLFEPYAHELLQIGGSFTVKRFQEAVARSKQDWLLPRGEKLVIDCSPEAAMTLQTAQDIRGLADSRYGPPNKDNFKDPSTRPCSPIRSFRRLSVLLARLMFKDSWPPSEPAHHHPSAVLCGSSPPVHTVRRGHLHRVRRAC